MCSDYYVWLNRNVYRAHFRLMFISSFPTAVACLVGRARFLFCLFLFALVTFAYNIEHFILLIIPLNDICIHIRIYSLRVVWMFVSVFECICKWLYSWYFNVFHNQNSTQFNIYIRYSFRKTSKTCDSLWTDILIYHDEIESKMCRSECITWK